MWIGKNCRRIKKGYSKADVHPDACRTYEHESYAALLYGCLDFSIAQINRTNFLAA